MAKKRKQYYKVIQRFYFGGAGGYRGLVLMAPHR